MGIEGVVEEILPGRVRGWCFDQNKPNEPVDVALSVAGHVCVDAYPASKLRLDLVQAKKGNGFHAFQIAHPSIDPDKDVQVLSEGQPLPALWNARTRVIRSMEEFDREVVELAKLEDGSMALFERCASFHLHEDFGALPIDPFSPEYKQTQMDLYSRIARKGRYNPWASEPISISVEHSVDPHPFPFSTKDPDAIGCHLIALGQILLTIKAANVRKCASILEYGCGTGFTTIFLAASGYDVTAVDINADALAVVDALAQRRGLPVTTFNGEFGQVPDETKAFDVILFYEAFHHSLEFHDLLITLFRRLPQGGVIIFAGEPIYADFPKPWGLRLDGHSAYAIRKVEWLELGFNETFFCDLLASVGFAVTKQAFEIGSQLYIAAKP